MKKYKLLIIGVLVSLFLLLPNNVEAVTNFGKESDTEFTAVNDAMYNTLSSLGISRGYAYVKYLRDGNKIWPVYCGDFPTSFAEGSDYALSSRSELGVQYIIKNGFKGDEHSNESYYFSTHSGCTQDSCSAVLGLRTNLPMNNQPWYVNYWLTQVAIWVFKDRDETWQEEPITDLKHKLIAGTGLNAYEAKIKELVDGANSITGEADFINVNPSLSVGSTTMTLDGDYYYSQLITASGTGDKYTISTSNSKYKVVDSNKNAKTTFNSGEKFYIRVAKGDISSSENVTVTISTAGKYFARQYYRYANQLIDSYYLEDSETKTNTLTLSLNYVKYCDIVIKILDAKTNKPVCSGSAQVKNSSGTVVSTVTFTSSNCTQTVSLPEGNYTVVQKDAPSGYVKNTQTYAANTNNACPTTIEIKNIKLCDIVIKILDVDTNKPVCDGSAQVKDSSGTVVKTVTFTKNNCTQTVTLPQDNYTVVQKDAPASYIKSTQTYAANTNNACPTTIEIKNKKLCDITIKITDVDTKAQICSGSVDIKDADDKVVQTVELTKDNCTPTVTLPVGNYKVVQKDVADSYIKDETVYEVDTLTTCPANVEIKNKKLCDITIKITNSITKEPICNATVVIKDGNDKDVQEVRITPESCTPTVNLPVGKYKVVQKGTEDAHVKDDNIYEINTITTCPATVEMFNPRLHRIKIVKAIEGTEKAIEGAKLKLEDSNGNTVLEFVSETEPTIINSLYDGTYYLSEVEAPPGYVLKEDKIQIDVNSENDDKLFYFYNDEIIVPITSNNSNLIIMSVIISVIGLIIIVYAKKKISNIS